MAVIWAREPFVWPLFIWLRVSFYFPELCHADAVGVNNGQMTYAGADKAFGALRAYAAHTENDDSPAAYLLHCSVSKQQF